MIVIVFTYSMVRVNLYARFIKAMCSVLIELSRDGTLHVCVCASAWLWLYTNVSATSWLSSKLHGGRILTMGTTEDISLGIASCHRVLSNSCTSLYSVGKLVLIQIPLDRCDSLHTVYNRGKLMWNMDSWSRSLHVHDIKGALYLISRCGWVAIMIHSQYSVPAYTVTSLHGH